jgi:hypothetical protein
MNSRLSPEVLLRPHPSPQADMPFETDGVLRYVWAARWGEMLIEVMNGEVYVDGQRVAPAQSALPTPRREPS